MKSSNILFSAVGVCFFASTTLASNVADSDIVTFTANATAKAAEVNQNFTAVKSAVNTKQNAVSETCPAGSAIRAINADGTVTCELGTAGLAGTTVLNVNCTVLPALTTAYLKVIDIGTFTKANASSVIDILLSTRFFVSTFTTGSTGATFELRVDDAATTNGRARATLRVGDVGNEGRLGTINGVFTGLGAGVHTVSLWALGWYAGGTNAGVDPGCFSSDHLVVKEIN